jgi:hypothetical protein
MGTTVMSRRASWSFLLLLGAAWLMPARLAAAEPTIRTLSVRGLQIAGTTTVVVDGDDLGTAPRLLLPFPAQQQLQPGGADKRAAFAVTLGADIEPGYYQLRVVTAGGVSLPAVIAVDRLPQRPLTPSVEQLPLALHGVVTGSTVVETRFLGKAGQKVLVEVEAQRLGNKLRPILHLVTPKQLQLAWSWSTPALFGDTRLEATLPEDGTYTVALHDAEYAAPAPGFFRLRIGQWSGADQVFPPVVGTGRQSVELLGPAAPTRVDVAVSPEPTVLALPWPKEGTWSGPRPFVTVASHPEILGQPVAGKPQDLPAGPVGVSGRLLAPFAEDRYRVPVTPGSKVRLEVFAERYGSPLDVAVVVRNETGGELARAEDSPGSLDPVLEYTVPDKVTAVVVGVVDSQGRGGPRGVYRLTIDPQGTCTAQADYRLLTPAQRVPLPAGGSAVVPVVIERRGFLGAVELSAARLPTGVRLEGTTILPGTDGTLVTVRRGDPAGDATVTTWRGRADDGQERTVVVEGHLLERLQPWLATELAVAPTSAKAADFQVDWRGLPADAGLVPAGKLALPVKLTRPTSDAVVRLLLVTSQVPQPINGQPNPALALRPEKPVELAATVTEGEVTVLVPPELSSPVYDVTVQADLLTLDRRTVLATAYAPVRRLAVRPPLMVHVDGAARIEVKQDPKTGTNFEVRGRVERREGLTGDVTVTLTGLPPGGRADPVVVKAGAADFTLKGVLPPNVPAGAVGGLKLSGTAAPDAKQPNVRVRSRDVAVTLAIQTAAK